MVDDARNPFWPMAAVLASACGGVAASILIAATLAGPIQESDTLEVYRYQMGYGNASFQLLDTVAMEKRIRDHAQSLGIPKDDVICVLARCDHDQYINFWLEVRTTFTRGPQLTKFADDTLRREMNRLEAEHPNAKYPPKPENNGCN
jgi:hypothetical protein